MNKKTSHRNNTRLWNICIKSPRRYFGYILELTNWILESGKTCHMTPEISDFVLVSIVETDKYIEVADWQRTICTILVRLIIFQYYVNEFGTYLTFKSIFLRIFL